MFDFLLRRHMPERTLIEYRAGLLDKDSSEMLEAHLLLCPTCQLELEELMPPTAAPGFLQLCRGRQVHGFILYGGSGGKL
jgi:hypothetical protein